MSNFYLNQVMDDVRQYLKFNSELFDEYKGDRDGLQEYLDETLWVDDSVTGNGSGSYTFNRWKAREYVLDNIDDLELMCADFCIDAETIGNKFLSQDWEWMDVSIRCFYLYQAIDQVLDDFTEELTDGYEDDDEDEDEEEE